MKVKYVKQNRTKTIPFCSFVNKKLKDIKVKILIVIQSKKLKKDMNEEVRMVKKGLIKPFRVFAKFDTRSCYIQVVDKILITIYYNMK